MALEIPIRRVERRNKTGDVEVAPKRQVAPKKHRRFASNQTKIDQTSNELLPNKSRVASQANVALLPIKCRIVHPHFRNEPFAKPKQKIEVFQFYSEMEVRTGLTLNVNKQNTVESGMA